jgi:hypothetical protein
MIVKSVKWHHWPNILAHFFLGIWGSAFCVFAVVGSIRLMKGESAWTSWLWIAVVFGLLVFPLFIRLAWTPIGYLKRIDLYEEYLVGFNLFGSEHQVYYSNIRWCRKSITNPVHGRGNPVVVVRTKKYPFHLEINLKGYSHRKAELLSIAINHKMERVKSKKW